MGPGLIEATYEFADLAELLRISCILRENPISLTQVHTKKPRKNTPRFYFIPVVCFGKLPIQ